MWERGPLLASGKPSTVAASTGVRVQLGGVALRGKIIQPPYPGSGDTQLTFPVLFSKFWDLRTSSSQPNFRLRFLSHGCASTNDVCKLQIHVFKTTNGQEQNYESMRPNYEKVLDRSRSHISKLRVRISRLRTEIFRLRLEVLSLEFSDYARTKNPATKPKFAWAKNNPRGPES